LLSCKGQKISDNSDVDATDTVVQCNVGIDMVDATITDDVLLCNHKESNATIANNNREGKSSSKELIFDNDNSDELD
jgi:hypothetical protein